VISCEDTRPQLTAYLDGELEGDAGSVVRGHLRGCEACRAVAADEAALRDGLRALPPVDVPPSLWAGVQARLAAAEVADAERPSWRRALARWTPQVRRMSPTFGAMGLAAAAAAALIVWRAHGVPGDLSSPPSSAPPIAQTMPVPAIAPDATHTDALASVIAPSEGDVTADLARDATRATAAYAAAAASLEAQLAGARASWAADRRNNFDARLTELRAAIAAADEGRPRQRALRAEIRYLQGALIRDEVASNDHMLAAPERTP
jgi:hypothetical protein